MKYFFWGLSILTLLFIPLNACYTNNYNHINPNELNIQDIHYMAIIDNLSSNRVKNIFSTMLMTQLYTIPLLTIQANCNVPLFSNPISWKEQSNLLYDKYRTKNLLINKYILNYGNEIAIIMFFALSFVAVLLACIITSTPIKLLSVIKLSILNYITLIAVIIGYQYNSNCKENNKSGMINIIKYSLLISFIISLPALILIKIESGTLIAILIYSILTVSFFNIIYNINNVLFRFTTIFSLLFNIFVLLTYQLCNMVIKYYK